MRLLGLVTLLAAVLFVASVPLDAASPRAATLLRVASLLLLVPGALRLGAAYATLYPQVVAGCLVGFRPPS